MSAWRGRELDDVLAELKLKATDHMRSKPPGLLPVLRPEGNSEDEIAEHEKRLGRPIPEPIRKLYSAVDGIDHTDEELHSKSGMTFLLSLAASHWVDPDDHSILYEEPSWKRDDYFSIGKSLYEDMVVFCEHPPGHHPGSIVMIDDQCANQLITEDDPKKYTPIVFLADNLG